MTATQHDLAKLIIKFINDLGATIDGDPGMKGRLEVVFVPDYSVSIAERLIPASDHEPGTRAALDLIAGEHFSPHERGVFAPIIDVLLRQGDYYMHLADLGSYGEAHNTRLGELYADQEQWSAKAVLNIAASRTFSSDRPIAEYARDIWHADPCPVG